MPFKNYSPKQKKLAMVAEPRDKITGADFKKLRMGKKKTKPSMKKMMEVKSCLLYTSDAADES